jgi:hypothetical protein
MKVIHVSNFKVLADVQIKDETYPCEFSLYKDLKICSLGVVNDETISPQDVHDEDLAKYQQAIDQFIENQSKLVMKSDYFGCFYRIKNTVLEYAAILDNGACDTEWIEVEFPASVQELNRINEYFKTNFTENDFEFVHGLE